MSVRAILDLWLLIEDFRNIDLYYQGQYHLQASLSLSGTTPMPAVPYYLGENASPDQDLSLPKSKINENSLTFSSQHFNVRFCEEEIELDDSCHFRLEVPVCGGYQSQSVEMEIGLYFQQKGNDDERAGSTRQLGSVKYMVQQVVKGVHEYIPVMFQDDHFCACRVQLHSVLLDYKYRPITVSLSDYLTQGYDNMPLDSLVKESLVGNHKITQTLLTQFPQLTLQKLRELLVNPLIRSYQHLLTTYKQVLTQCVTKQQQKQHSFLQDGPQDLRLPDMVSTNASLENQCQQSLQESNFIGLQVYQLWHQYIEILRMSTRYISGLLEQQYQIKIKGYWQQYIVKSKAQVSNLGELHQQEAGKLRAQQNHRPAANMVTQVGMFPCLVLQPVIFEQQSVDPAKQEENVHDIELALDQVSNQSYKGIHLFILVHGFQGNAQDMKQIKAHLAQQHPESMFLCSSCNEHSETEGDILEMGLRLSQEVGSYIQENLPVSSLGRLSFVGHSMGGLIIRAALPHLGKYKDKLYTYLSLGSPHLGYQYSNSKLVEAGIWLLKKWRKSTSLAQLSDNTQDSFLLKLSESPGLGWFSHVVLVSSYQDQYVPFDSARVSPVSKQDLSQEGERYGRMVDNILGQMQRDSHRAALLRLDVSFGINQTNLNSMIGRTAHILFLENQAFIRMLLCRYEHLFT